MKKRDSLLLFALLILILGACAKKAILPVDNEINPGEKIGGILVTTGEEGKFIKNWDLECIEQDNKTRFTCNSTVGTVVNISVGIYGDQNGTLDEYWSGQTYELFINDRPVNLQAFGFIDIDQAYIGKMRLWNVVIVAEKPEDITIHDVGVVGDDAIEYITTITFDSP
jgi:hypothetical protein